MGIVGEVGDCLERNPRPNTRIVSIGHDFGVVEGGIGHNQIVGAGYTVQVRADCGCAGIHTFGPAFVLFSVGDGGLGGIAGGPGDRMGDIEHRTVGVDSRGIELNPRAIGDGIELSCDRDRVECGGVCQTGYVADPSLWESNRISGNRP